MSGAHPRKLRGSLGDSWGYADDSSDGGASINSTSSFTDEEFVSEDDMPTPLPPRVTRASSQTPRDQDITPSARQRNSQSTPSVSRTKVQRAAQTSQSYSPTTHSVEPRFIMPSMGTINSPQNGSPLRKSQLRPRKTRSSTSRSPSDKMGTSNQTSEKAEANLLPYEQYEEDPKLSRWINLVWRHVLWPITAYILSVFRYAMHNFGTPILGTALTVFLLAAGLHFTTTFLQSTIQRTLTPLCLIPGSSYIVPFCSTYSHGPSTSTADFDTLASVQSAFTDVVEASKQTSDLSMHIRIGTNSVSDIRSLVKHSELPSRHLLDVELATFMEIGKEASESLIQYNVKITRTLSKLIITNDWTLRDLSSLAADRSTSSPISRALSSLNPLSVFTPPPPSLESQVYDRYTVHLTTIKEEISSLIEIALTLKSLLSNLESQLDIIGDTAVHDNMKISQKHDLLLSSLWSILGGNRSSKSANIRSLQLLQRVMEYKARALEHVTSTLATLQEIDAGLAGLQADVGEPLVKGFLGEEQLRRDIDTISSSLEGFKDLRGERLGAEREDVRRALGRLGESGQRDGVRELPDRVAGMGEGTREPLRVFAK